MVHTAFNEMDSQSASTMPLRTAPAQDEEAAATRPCGSISSAGRPWRASWTPSRRRKPKRSSSTSWPAGWSGQNRPGRYCLRPCRADGTAPPGAASSYPGTWRAGAGERRGGSGSRESARAGGRDRQPRGALPLHSLVTWWCTRCDQPGAIPSIVDLDRGAGRTAQRILRTVIRVGNAYGLGSVGCYPEDLR